MLAIMYAANGKPLSIGNPEKLKPKTKKELEQFGFIFNQTDNIYVFGGDDVEGGEDKDKGEDKGEDKDEDEDGKNGEKVPIPPKKAPGLNIDYNTAGSKITERIILRNLINNRWKNKY